MKKDRFLMALSAAFAAAILFYLLPSFAEPQRGSSSSSERAAQTGKDLFLKLKCASCHSVDGVGGCIAPPLDNVTRRRSPEYLMLRLGASKEDKFVQLIKHPELFPHPRFQESQVKALLAYLKTLERKPLVVQSQNTHKVPASLAQEKPSPSRPQTSLAPRSASAKEGRRLFLELGCLSCHSVGNTGGAIGPSLDGISSRHSIGFIAAHITDPQAHLKSTQPGAKTKMVQSDLLPDQVKSLTDYLLSLPKLKE